MSNFSSQIRLANLLRRRLAATPASAAAEAAPGDGGRRRSYTTAEWSRPSIVHKRSVDILHDPWFNKNAVKNDFADSTLIHAPNQYLSLAEEKATVSLVDEKVEEHGLKPSEVYGFVGSITTIVATEPWLHYLSITYYPSKHWTLGVPTFVMVSVVLALSFYIGLNFMATPPPTSFDTIFDEYNREPSSSVRNFSDDDGEQPIEPISDIPITHIKKLMFGRRLNSKE